MPWVRRIVSTSVLLALVGGLIFGAVHFFGVLKNVLQDQHEKTAIPNVAEPVTIEECAFQDLGLQLRPEPQSQRATEPIEVLITVVNEGEEACSLQTESLDVTMKIGAEVIWEPIKCDPSWGRTLLLKEGQDWVGSLTWNGRTFVDCENISVVGSDGISYLEFPGAGTFTIEGSLNGKRLARTTVSIYY